MSRMEGVVRAREQGLEDVAASGGAEVVVLCSDTPGLAASVVDEVTARAWRRGFLVAEVSLASMLGLDAFDSLVRTVLRSCGAPGTPIDERGLVAVLNGFANAHGDGAVSVLERGLAQHGVYGDLGELARAYVDVSAGPRREAQRLTAWIDGTPLPPARPSDPPGALTLKTSRRALGEVTRLARALGYRGTLLALTHSEALPKLPAARRRNAYVLLRELIDNVDGGRGLEATSVLVAGGGALIVGPRSVDELRPLAMRLKAATPAHVPLPHATVVDLDHVTEPDPPPEVRPPRPQVARQLRALLRAAHGLPPTEGVPELSVAYEEIDRRIEQLFSHGTTGSVFALLTGEYGSGKTHLLLHLAERALERRSPVFHLNVERLEADLGNPQRHLRRLLEDAVLPLPGRPSPLDLAHRWLSTRATTDRLVAVLGEIAAAGGEAGRAAEAGLARAKDAEAAVPALLSFLGARDLADKPAQPAVRMNAYRRFLLWLALLDRLEKLRGPVLIVDEAENLFREGVKPAERRTALRSLAFYTSGTLDAGAVVLAVTPEALRQLRQESQALLAQIGEQVGMLAVEDPSMLSLRLRRTRLLEVPALAKSATRELAGRVAAVHAKVRGPVPDAALEALVGRLARSGATPREVVRRAVGWLEAAWWTGEALE
ncbi:MAG: DUF2791 family P-loop domain-containing protein [Polyangiaceae bacterium]|nr:DUF2791 family P-loop domain-containing protein [Polyangiaceae bacterium]